jgi:hypothetical protein
VANVGLDDWIGKDVGVLFVPRNPDEKQEPVGCTLESADERGVMLSHHDTAFLARNFGSSPGTKSIGSNRLTQ